MSAKLVTAKEIAARYSVHRKTLEKWYGAGIIPVVKINPRCIRFDVEKCDAAMQRRSTGAVQIGLCAVLATASLLLPILDLVASMSHQSPQREVVRIIRNERVISSNLISGSPFFRAILLLFRELENFLGQLTLESLGVSR